MVMEDDATNNFDASALKTVSIEYNITDPPEYTKILKSPQIGMIIGYHVPNM
jgi:hypothetical protein